jgi:hypothetical protein
VLFHVIASGRCWVALPGGERYWASAGEVIVLPYGDEFLMGGARAATPVHQRVVPMPPWTGCQSSAWRWRDHGRGVRMPHSEDRCSIRETHSPAFVVLAGGRPAGAV